MAARFRTAVDRSQAKGGDTEAARERRSFDRARARLKLRQAAFAWTFGALLAFGIALATGITGRSGAPNPGVIIGGVFSAMAVATWIASIVGDAERWSRAYGIDQP